MAHYKAISLQIAQRKSQHALGDPVNLVLERREAEPLPTRAREAPDNLDRPFVAEARADPVRRAWSEMQTTLCLLIRPVMVRFIQAVSPLCLRLENVPSFANVQVAL